jgi:hypothetical protein
MRIEDVSVGVSSKEPTTAIYGTIENNDGADGFRSKGPVVVVRELTKIEDGSIRVSSKAPQPPFMEPSRTMMKAMDLRPRDK